MQTNPAVEQNKNIKWSESPCLVCLVPLCVSIMKSLGKHKVDMKIVFIS